MKLSATFYKCDVCGNMVVLFKNGGGKLICCDKPMTELKANTAEASAEKHIPAVSVTDEKIKVQAGSVIHPMVEEHYIEWIAMVTDNTIEVVSLSPGQNPEAVFCHKGSGEIFSYCNLHGLWKTEVK